MGGASRNPSQILWLNRAPERGNRSPGRVRIPAAAAEPGLSAGAWSFGRGATKAQPTQAGDDRTGVAHFGDDARRDLASAGAFEKTLCPLPPNTTTPRSPLAPRAHQPPPPFSPTI